MWNHVTMLCQLIITIKTRWRDVTIKTRWRDVKLAGLLHTNESETVRPPRRTGNTLNDFVGHSPQVRVAKR